MCQKEVHLCFSQARRIKAEEDLPLDETLNNNQTTNMANGNQSRAYKSNDVESARTARDGAEEDEEEDSPPPVQKKRPVAKKSVRR